MSIYTKNSKNTSYKIILKNDIRVGTISLEKLELLLTDHGYKNTQYCIVESHSKLRLEITDNDSSKLDQLVNQLWEHKLLASNDEECHTWF